MSALELLKSALLYDQAEPLIFSTGLFFLLFCAFYAVFLLLKDLKTWRTLWMFAFSAFVYYKSSGLYLAVLMGVVLWDYFLAFAIAAEEDPAKRRAWLAGSVAVNLGLLAYFKYFNLLLGTFQQIQGAAFTPWDIFLPAGISFHTFQSISYTVDVSRRQIKPVKSLLDYAFFVTFFPQLVAGPIVRAVEFIPQIRAKLKLSEAGFARAWTLLLCGLFKKAVISDLLSVNFVDRVFDSPGLYTPLENWLAVYGYAAQIYCDFSGYSDMAIGLALLMGFKFPLNFDSPYQSASLTEFWRRWHMSLSRWLRDYLYIPLGGNRLGSARTYLNLMLTMVLGGLWHGASWKFMAWGALHGLGLALEKALGLEGTAKNAGWLRALRVGLTFHIVCFGWIFFRAKDFGQAGVVISRMLEFRGFSHAGEILAAHGLFLGLMSLAFLLHFTGRDQEEKLQQWSQNAPLWGKAAALAGLVWLVAQVKTSAVQPFIYFQF